MKRIPILIAMVLTILSLGIVGAVVKAASDARATGKVAELEQEIQDQKMAYAEMISEANSRLTEANTVIEENVSRNHQLEQVINSPAPRITMDKAISLAMVAVGQSGVPASGHAELVDYNGTIAYEVMLPDETKIYLDSDDGHLLYNSLTGGPSAVIDDQKALFEAVTYMQGGQVVSVEKSTYEGQPAFLVTFSSGDQVYVSLGGQVLTLIQPGYYGYSSVSYDSTESGGSSKSSSRKEDHDDDHEDEHEEEHESEDD
jgi:hypothetical protein